jgi:hypothetical protein
MTGEGVAGASTLAHGLADDGVMPVPAWGHRHVRAQSGGPLPVLPPWHVEISPGSMSFGGPIEGRVQRRPC